MSAMIAIATVGALTRTRIVGEMTRLERARLRIAATWKAEGCLELARADIDAALLGSTSSIAATWAGIDHIVAASSGDQVQAGCAMSARAGGVTLTAADRRRVSVVSRYLQLSGFRGDVVDSLASSLADWEDTDNVQRAAGAESLFYAEHGRLGPRNAPIVNASELGLVRGFESDEIRRAASGIVGGTSEELCAAHASGAVIATRLSVSIEVAESIRRAERPEVMVAALGMIPSKDTRDESRGWIANRQVVAACSHWRITASVALGNSRDSASATIAIVSANRRAALVGVEVLSR
jgi:Type II secretion system (T2SS), protein K